MVSADNQFFDSEERETHTYRRDKGKDYRNFNYLYDLWMMTSENYTLDKRDNIKGRGIVRVHNGYDRGTNEFKT